MSGVGFALVFRGASVSEAADVVVSEATSACVASGTDEVGAALETLRTQLHGVNLDDRVAINAKQRSTRGAVTLKDGTIKTKKGVEIKATEAFWCGGNEYMGREVFDMLESSKSGQLVVDFTTKAPKVGDLSGVWTGARLDWEDGNAWTKLAASEAPRVKLDPKSDIQFDGVYVDPDIWDGGLKGLRFVTHRTGKYDGLAITCIGTDDGETFFHLAGTFRNTGAPEFKKDLTEHH